MRNNEEDIRRLHKEMRDGSKNYISHQGGVSLLTTFFLLILHQLSVAQDMMNKEFHLVVEAL